MASYHEANGGLKQRLVGAVARHAVRHASTEVRVQLGVEALKYAGIEPTNHTERNFLKPEIANLAPGDARIILRHIHHEQPEKFPKVIAIIPDGNGRFEEAHEELEEGDGYRIGADVIKNGLEGFEEFSDQIDTVFIWAWSKDNEGRDPKQKQITQGIIKTYLNLYTSEMKAKGFRIEHRGKKENFIEGLEEAIKNAEDETRENKGTTVLIGINYGAQTIAEERARLIRQPSDVSEDPETGYFDFSYRDLTEGEIKDIEIKSMGMNYADLTFRTAGEQRLSGLLPAAFGEIVITEKTNPQMNGDDFDKMLLEGICRRVSHGRARPGSKYFDGNVNDELFQGDELAVAFANILDQHKREESKSSA